MPGHTRVSATTGRLPDGWWLAALSGAETEALPAKPGWAALVEAALAVAPAVGSVGAVAADAPGEAHLVGPLEPFLEVASAALTDRISAIPGTAAAIDTVAVHDRVLAWLGTGLTRLAARTLVAELHAARARGQLRGATAQDRFADFLRHVGSRLRLADLLARHPVLARLLGQACVEGVDAAAELLERFAADRPALVSGLLEGDPGALTDLTPGAGDRHDGGRSVTLLQFAGGSRLVYRPRPVGLQARFGELLGELAERNPELGLRGTGVLVRDGYGWTEYVAHAPCRDAWEVERFYHRQGVLLALLYALDATDVHYENLVAHGDQPVVVDVETLLHPGFTPSTNAGDDPALAALHASVARTALLPTTVFGEHGATDVSAFGGGSGGEPSHEGAVWCEAGTDGMRLERARVPLPPRHNRPLLGDREVDPADYRDHVVLGFRAGYDALVDQAGELVAPDGPLDRLTGERIRVVVRHTATYAQLLTEASQPSALVDGAARERVFAALRSDTAQPHLGALLPHEVAALFAGDIPLFTAAADSRDVFSDRGCVVPGLLHRSGLDAVRAKLTRLSAVDRREQEWVVRAALATHAARVRHGDGTVDPFRAATTVPPDAQHVLSLARGIGDELVARSRQDGVRANWLGVEAVDGRFWSLLPMGAGLAEGYCGTALFLAQLGAVSGIGRFSELARKAVRGLPQLLAVLVRHPELARQVGSGAFAGFGGIAYAVARLANLLDDEAVAACLPDAVAVTVMADLPGRAGVEDGTAGAVAALLAVHAESGLPAAAEAAAALAARLPAAPGGRPGFLHGATGARWASGRFARATGRPAPPLDVRGVADGLSWCGGTTGDVLAAIDTDTLDVAAPQLDAYVAAAAARPPSDDHSLCHGDLGALDALVELAAAGHTGAAAALAPAGGRLVSAVERRGPRCGTPRNVPSPGLLTGTAGIGYGLLRLAFADRVPSVLLLRPGRRAAEPFTYRSTGE